MKPCRLIDNTEETRFCLEHSQLEIACIGAERDRYKTALESNCDDDHDGRRPHQEVRADPIRPINRTEIEMSNVEHPKHYGGDTPYEVIKVIKAWGLMDNACRFNAIKYLARAGKKDDLIQDLEKARFYLDYEINMLKEQRAAEKAAAPEEPLPASGDNA